MFGDGAPNQADLVLVTLHHVSSFTCLTARATSTQVPDSVTNKTLCLKIALSSETDTHLPPESADVAH